MTVPYRRAAPWTFLVYWIVLALAGCGRQILWPPSGPWRRGGRGRGCWSWWPSKATLYPHCVQSKKTKSLKTISKAAERLIIRKLVMNPRDFNWRWSLLQPFLTTRGKQKPSIYLFRRELVPEAHWPPSLEFVLAAATVLFCGGLLLLPLESRGLCRLRKDWVFVCGKWE